MFLRSRNGFARRTSSSSLWSIRQQRRRQQAFRVRDRLCNGTRNLMPCRTCVFKLVFRLSFPFSFVQPSSHLIMYLYAKRLAHPDTLIGAQETPVPVESQTGLFFYENLISS